MSRITQLSAVAPIELFSTSTSISAGTQTGQRFYSSDGREFVLVQNGGSAIAAGLLCTGPASVANHQGLTVTKYTAASSNGLQPAQVTATLGGTLVTANQYQGGYMFVATGTGIGQTLKIASHPAGTSVASVVFTLEDSPAVALVAASSTVSLIANPYGSLNGTDYTTLGVVVASTTKASRGELAGMTLYALPASTATVPVYGLLQTRGYIASLNYNGTAIGLDIGPATGAGTAGYTMTYAVATQTRVGYQAETGTNAQAGLVYLQL